MPAHLFIITIAELNSSTFPHSNALFSHIYTIASKMCGILFKLRSIVGLYLPISDLTKT